MAQRSASVQEVSSALRSAGYSFIPGFAIAPNTVSGWGWNVMDLEAERAWYEAKLGMKVVGITTGHTASELQPSNLVINDYTEVTVQKLAALFG